MSHKTQYAYATTASVYPRSICARAVDGTAINILSTVFCPSCRINSRSWRQETSPGLNGAALFYCINMERGNIRSQGAYAEVTPRHGARVPNGITTKPSLSFDSLPSSGATLALRRKCKVGHDSVSPELTAARCKRYVVHCVQKLLHVRGPTAAVVSILLAGSLPCGIAGEGNDDVEGPPWPDSVCNGGDQWQQGCINVCL